MASLIKRFASIPWIAEVIAMLGGIVYLIQLIRFATMQVSILDEGAYLYKGYLFATGQYTPFQDFGPWMNHMPFSFLIPGYVQTIFGPGLRTGRFFSVALALFMLLGLWIVSKRLGGRWWAVGAVWAVALNPMFSRIYSNSSSQVLIACLLIWILVLAMNERTIPWQICLGSALAGISLLTRLNMAPVLPILLGYIFWQHGKRTGLLATITGIFTVIIGHALYWPGILRLWASWLPSSLTPFLDVWRRIDSGIKLWDPDPSFNHRLLSFWWGIRSNFIALVGFIGLGFLVFQPKSWENEFYRRSGIFLSILITLLVAAHAWASLMKNYCVFCFQVYLTFFAPVAFLLIIIIFRGWKGARSIGFVLYSSVLVLLISAGIGFGTYRDFGRALIEFSRFLKKGGIIARRIPLWNFLENRFGLPYETSKVLIPSLLGLAVGILVLFLAWSIYRRQSNRKADVNFGLIAIAIMLIVGLILSPTSILGNGYQDNDCEGDVINANETAGQYLAEVIPIGSQVYWQGTDSAVPMLYLPGVSLYLPQIDQDYTYSLGGNSQEMLRIGLWNDELAEGWKLEADFVVIAEQKYTSAWEIFFKSGQFEELPKSPSLAPCRDESRLRIFRRRITT
ncbi:MAG: glycosyltransferase family 39 protein [Chloroflexota bacterium]|nr:MAG: glycosyltransferase family 39 protein [Chloroflexota bacterium]